MNNNRALSLALLATLLLPFFASAQSAQSSCPNFSRNLSLGSRGADVIQLQNFLIAQNLLPQGDNTGYFRRLTRAATIELQTQQSIPSTGLVGPLTRAAIASVCGASQSVNQTINQTTNQNTNTVRNAASAFSASPTTGIAPWSIGFDYADPAPGHTYTVDFGDGSSGTLVSNYGATPPGCAGCQRTPSYAVDHIYKSGGTYIAKVKDASGDVLGTATITLVDRPPTVTFTVPGTVTLSVRQTAVRNIGASQDAFEQTGISTDGNGLLSVNFTWQNRDCGTTACTDTESSGIGSVSGYLDLNSANASWRTPEGYLITLTALTASTATFQISQ
jgi:Putative peptidoglycan binding domain